ADRLTILRDGLAVYTGPWGEISAAEMIRHMAGRELKEIFPPRNARVGEVKLRVTNLTRPPKFENVSFEARAGEVVGVAGLAGAGRTELVESICGAQAAQSGRIEFGSEKITSAEPNHSIARGLCLLTEDRKRTGLCLNLPLATNITLANVRALVRGGRLQRRAEFKATNDFIRKLSIRPPSPAKPVGRLSGGNQQQSPLPPS